MSSNNRKHRIGFYLLGVASVTLIIATGYRTFQTELRADQAKERADKSQRDLSKAIDSLKDNSLAVANMSKEALRIGTLNTELQKQALEQANTITNLSKETIDTIVGGDSFCYLRFAKMTDTGGIPVFLNPSKYPVYEVTAIISEFGKPDTYEDTPPALDVGNIGPNNWSKSFKKIEWDNATKHIYTITFGAKNGLWVQGLKAKKINGKWVQGVFVYRIKGPHPGETNMYKHIFRDFPKEISAENWYGD